MDGEVALSVVAQIALALAGFTGVVSVLYSPSASSQVNNLKATELIFEHTFVVAFLGLLPFPLHYSLPSGLNHYRILWCLASGAFAVAVALLVGVQNLSHSQAWAKRRSPSQAASLHVRLFPYHVHIVSYAAH
jgi:hypothetical protein